MGVEFNPASSYGIQTGGPDFRALFDKISTKELDRLKPNQALEEKYKTSEASWKETRTRLEKVELAAKIIADRNTFAGRLVTSSDPEIVTATATSMAEPGVHQITVDKIALYHQIGSQRYSKTDDIIGNGNFWISFEDERPFAIKIDDTNHTLQGLADAINNAKLDISASIAKIGNDDNPYQLVLTSKRSGEEGRIIVRTELVGGEAPLFEYRYNQPTKWYYAPGKKVDDFDGTLGASSSVIGINGNFTGTDDNTFTFKVVSPGKVGGKNSPTVSWADSKGRGGLMKLGSYDYQSGTPLEIADGLQVSFSEGELVANDSFTVQGKAATSSFLGIFGTDAPAKFDGPSNWNSQKGGGKLMIEGAYTGPDDDHYKLNVTKGGVVGTSPNVLVEYQSESGQKGLLDVGLGYKPGAKLGIGNGLTISIPSGVLQDGFTSEFDVEPSVANSRWWLFEDGDTDGKPGLFSMPLDWDGKDSNAIDPNVYDPRTKKSNAPKRISGTYKLDEDKKYKFTARGEGKVGITTGLYLDWEDDKGNKGSLEVGPDYPVDTPIPFDGGLNVHLDNGFIFEGDYFYVEAKSPTITPAQNAEVRIGVTESAQGGQRVTSPTNEVVDAIPYVTLSLHKADPKKVVTITISEDREKVKNAIKDFINSYNEALKYIKEQIKYDPETKIAGPLQAERTLIEIQDKLRTILVDAIPGLPTDANTLPYAGVKINKDGLIDFDEKALDQRLVDNYEKVVNIFRSYAATANSGIRFAGSKITTKPSGVAGYPIDVAQTASKGYFKSTPFNGPIEIPPGDNRYTVTVDGRTSEPITIDEGPWSLRQIVREVSKKIKRDKVLSNGNQSVAMVDGSLKIDSGNYGATSEVTINRVSGTIPFASGSAVKGTDVAGTINGHPAIGSGQLLIGSKGFPEEDLQFYVLLGGNQVNGTAPEATAIFTVGKGNITENYLDEQLKNKTGPVDTSIKAYSDRVQGLEDRLQRQKDAIERKKERLSKQFSNAEARIGTLKAQQADYLAQGLTSG